MLKIYVKMAVALVLGIIIAGHINIFYTLIMCAVLIISVLILRKITGFIKGYWILVIAAFSVGSVLSLAAQSYETNGLFPVDDKFITLNGYVYQIPEKNEDRYSYVIRTQSAEYLGVTYNAQENVRLSSETKLQYAQSVKIRGFLKRINEKKNHNEFDYNLYYKSKDIFYKITDYEVVPQDIKELTGIRHWSNIIRIKAINLIDKYFKGDKAAIFKAVITGNKKSFSKEFTDLLYHTNIMRLFYPAFLHILLIMGIINAFGSFVDKKIRNYIILAALIVYALFNLESAVLVKSAVLMVVTVITLKFKGYAHYPDMLSITVMAILITNPLIVYSYGFIISITVGILYFILKEPLGELFCGIKNPKIRRFVIFSLTTTVGIMPLTAYFFCGASLHSIFINYIYTALVVTIIFFFPLLAAGDLLFKNVFFIDNIIDAVLGCMERIPYIIDKIPFSYIDMGRPPFLGVILFYVGILLVRVIYINGIRNKKAIALYVVLAGGILSLAVYEGIFKSGTEYAFVNVGQGDASYIRLSSGEVIIVDGGGSAEYSDYDAGEEIFIPYLKSEGIFNIDVAIVTHYHKDHCLGTIAALEHLNVKSVFMPDVTPSNGYRVEIEELAREQGADIYYVKQGDRIEFNSGAVIEIISPTDEMAEEENDTSIVFMIEDNGFRALYMGDATEETEKKCMNYFKDVDLVKVGHHGSLTSTTDEFVEKIKPEIAVITVGEDNVYNLPHPDVVERLTESGATVFRTDENGDISFIVFKNGKIIYNTFKNS